MYSNINLLNENKNTVINKTIEVLKKGGLVIFPSDTVYGVLVDASNEAAVHKLISFKNRAPGKAIAVFVQDIEMVKKYVKVNQTNLLNHLLPGPFTLVFESKHLVNHQLESEKGTLGVRIPVYPLISELVKKYGKPVTATSANLGGKSPHYSVRSLLNELPESKKKLIDLIVDAGVLPRNKPSTVVDLSQGSLKTLRKGDIVFSNESTYLSTSPSQTQKIGRFIIDQLVRKGKQKPVVIILQGDLGSGKTVLTKGIADHFDITNIVSPTFVVYYEYDMKSRNPKSEIRKFVHADLYNIEDPEEFSHLGLEEYLIPGNVMVVEWGEKLGDLYKKFKDKAKIIFISILYKGEEERAIQVSYS